MKCPYCGSETDGKKAYCPDCGGKHESFGASRAEETAKRLGIPAVARMPIDPKLAAACDAGTVELFEGDWLNGLFDTLL